MIRFHRLVMFKGKGLRDIAAAAFVLFEACMHVYLLFYLTFVNWTNLLIWGFTAFELSMFLFLLWNGKENSNVKEACSACARVYKRVHR